jgi:hypothetical protein
LTAEYSSSVSASKLRASSNNKALMALIVGLREAGTGLTPSWRAEARHPRLGYGLHPRQAWMATFIGMTLSRSSATGAYQQPTP